MFEIIWRAKAYRQLRKIKDRKIADTIYDAVNRLKNWPHSRNVKALVDHAYGYRLRVGSWRVFFDVRQEIEIVEAREVKKCNERTY